VGIPIGAKPGGPVYNPPPRPPRPPRGNPPTQLPGESWDPRPPVNIPGVPEGSYNIPASMPSVYQPGRVGALAPLIDQYLARYDSPLAGLGKVFTKKSKKYGIDPRLLVAIAGAETNFGTYGPSQGIHNPFGMGPGINYPNYGTAIEQTARNLGENYFGQGYNTIPKIQGKWAPSGAANDPTDLNSNWTRNVTKFYNELGKMKPKNSPIPGLSQVIFDPRGSWFNGTLAGPQGGHESHVHLGANNPRILLRAIQMAQNRGFRASENPYTDQVDPVHTGISARYGDTEGQGDPSYHYRLFSGRYGPDRRELGRGLDVSGGTTAQLGAYYDDILRLFAPGYTSGYAGGSMGGGYDITGPASPQQVYAAQQAQQQVANTGGAIMASAESPVGGTDRRRKRKKAADDEINQLIAALSASARGAEIMQKKRRKRGV
jgi:hypothetical protein